MIKKIIALLFLVSVCIPAVHFDGVDDYDFAASPLAVDSRFTCIVSFYPTTLGKDILGFDDGTNSTYVFTNADGSVRYARSVNYGTVLLDTSAGEVIANKWNTLALGWDGSKLFLCINNNSYYTVNSTCTITTAPTRCRIGDAWGAAHYVGEIHQIGIWSYAMSREQICSMSKVNFIPGANARAVWIYNTYGTNRRTQDIAYDIYQSTHMVGTTESLIYNPILIQRIYPGD